MKRLIAVGIILVLLIGVCIMHHFFITDSLNALEEYAQKYEDNQKNDNLEQLTKISNDLCEEWEKRRILLSFFVNHTMIEEIDESVENLHSYTDTESYDLSYAECNTLKKRLEKMEKDTGVHIESVF